MSKETTGDAAGVRGTAFSGSIRHRQAQPLSDAGPVWCPTYGGICVGCVVILALSSSRGHISRSGLGVVGGHLGGFGKSEETLWFRSGNPRREWIMSKELSVKQLMGDVQSPVDEGIQACSKQLKHDMVSRVGLASPPAPRPSRMTVAHLPLAIGTSSHANNVVQVSTWKVAGVQRPRGNRICLKQKEKQYVSKK